VEVRGKAAMGFTIQTLVANLEEGMKVFVV
jgi:hypothetical protein